MTDAGGTGGGAIFELVPLQGGGASFSVQYTFSQGQGYSDPLTLDASGNIYAATYAGGAHDLGAIYTLTRSGSGWTYTTLFNNDQGDLIGNVVRDAQGNIYGATLDGGNGFGSVYELTP